MSDDVEAQVRSIRDRLAAATRARVRAEHEHDAAQVQADRYFEQLHREFGVSSIAEAKDALAGLEKDLTDALETVRTALTETGV